MIIKQFSYQVVLKDQVLARRWIKKFPMGYLLFLNDTDDSRSKFIGEAWERLYFFRV
jgi:hypothetical protein